jgi:hypothetical protein
MVVGLGCAVSEIKRFSGFKLVMFFQDENPPHVHIKGLILLRKSASRIANSLPAMRLVGS